MLGNEATRRRSSKRIGASKAQNCRDGATYVKLPAWSQHRRWIRETYLIALHHNTLRLCLDLEFMERNIGEIPMCLLYLFYSFPFLHKSRFQTQSGSNVQRESIGSFPLNRKAFRLRSLFSILLALAG